MTSVLIVEDDRNEFNQLKSKFLKEGWDVIPQDYSQLESYFSREKREKLIEEVW